MLWFLDSSALVKRYVSEPGSAWLLAELMDHELLIAQVTPVELAAAIGKRHRTGDISRFTFYQARQRLLQDLDTPAYIITGLKDSIIKTAQALTFTQGLRAYDAIQLATALHAVGLGTLNRLTFVTADTKLEAAARAEGLQTDNPLSH